MKLLIAGSRDYTNYSVVNKVCTHLLTLYDIDTIISGHARGADTLGERFAHEHDLQLDIYPADWNTYGRSAGYIRNEIMIKHADMCVVFWNGTSPGTKHTINLARKYGVKLIVIKKGDAL